MSNLLFIELVESKIVGSKEVSYKISVYDSYGSSNSIPYTSLSDMIQDFPTQLSILAWVENLPEFEGSFTIEGKEVTLDCVTGIIFDGFPGEDDSFYIKES